VGEVLAKRSENAEKKSQKVFKMLGYHADLVFQLRLLSEEQERSEAEIWSCEKQRGGLLANNSFYRSRKTKKIVILCCDKTFEDGNRKRRGGWSVSLVGEVQLGYLQEAAGSLQLENN
jgi:hypothetical protein